MAPFQLSGQRHRGGADRRGVPPFFQTQVDMQATVAGRLRVADQAEFGQKIAAVERRGAYLVEPDARLGIEIDPQLVRERGIGGEIRPQMQTEAAQVHGPDHMRDIGHHERVGGCSVRGGHGGRLQPRRGAGGHPLLEEGFPGGTVGKALEQGGTATGGVEQRVGHQEVIGDKVELGRAEFGKVDLVGARDMYLSARDLYQTLLVA